MAIGENMGARANTPGWLKSVVAAQVLLGVVAIGVSVYASVRIRPLFQEKAQLTRDIANEKQQFDQTHAQLEKERAELNNTREQLSALQLQVNNQKSALQAVKALRAGSRTVIQYFYRDKDRDQVEAALGKLGFYIEKGSSKVSQVPTNAIWFGRGVKIDDVKLVAFALMQNGVQLKSIRPFDKRSTNYSKPLIQVGADLAVADRPSLNESSVRTAQSFNRQT
jgi:hypothetical protein